MKLPFSHCLAVIFVLLLPALAALPVLAAEPCESPPALRFSLVPTVNVEARLKAYQPLFKRIELLTGKAVIAVRPTSYASVVEGLLGDALDIAYIGPAGYIEVSRANPDIQAFATTSRRDGVFQSAGPQYHSLLVTRSSSRFRDIASLKGARLALTDPGSTSGALLPRRQFQPVVGMPLDKFFGSISHTGSHTNSIVALLKGEVDAAFVAATNLEDALHNGKLKASDVRVLWKSAPIAHSPFVYRGRLCEPLKRQIRAAFLTDAAALQPVLDDLHAVAFVPVSDEHYADVRAALATATR